MIEADRMAYKAANLLPATDKTIADLGPKFEALQTDEHFCRTLDGLAFRCTECEIWRDMREASEYRDKFICDECDGNGCC